MAHRGASRAITAGRARVHEERRGRPALGHEHVAAEQPVGIDEVLGRLPVNGLQLPEERVRPLGLDLGEERDRLAPRRLRLSIGLRREADDLTAREDRGGQRAGAASRMRISTVRSGGSSRVLRKACGVSSVIRSASSTMKILRAATAGRRAAWRSSALMSPMRMARGPLGFRSGGVGTIRWRSGCWRFLTSPQPWQRPHPPSAEGRSQSSASANANAAPARPDRGGPTKA